MLSPKQSKWKTVSKLIADNLKINNKVDINKDENIKKIINGGKLTKNAYIYIF